MRSSSRWIAWAIFVIGLLLCAGNLWFTAARTTIPLSLQLTVVDKEIRHEKHPGFDDIHLLRFSDGEVMVVDGAIFEAIAAGDPIMKDRWSRTFHVGNREIPLEWSADVRGMMWVMPAAALRLFILAFPARAKARGDVHA